MGFRGGSDGVILFQFRKIKTKIIVQLSVTVNISSK